MLMAEAAGLMATIFSDWPCFTTRASPWSTSMATARSRRCVSCIRCRPALNVAQRRRLRACSTVATRAAPAHRRLPRRGRPCPAPVWPRAGATARSSRRTSMASLRIAPLAPCSEDVEHAGDPRALLGDLGAEVGQVAELAPRCLARARRHRGARRRDFHGGRAPAAGPAGRARRPRRAARADRADCASADRTHISAGWLRSPGLYNRRAHGGILATPSESAPAPLPLGQSRPPPATNLASAPGLKHEGRGEAPSSDIGAAARLAVAIESDLPSRTLIPSRARKRSAASSDMACEPMTRPPSSLQSDDDGQPSAKLLARRSGVTSS